jgi:multiple sugar transport system ATP-binding protein
MRELIRTEQLSSGVTTIYVTHDQEEAMSLADRIVVMAGGNIQQVGTPAEVYDRPQHMFVATFVGSPGMNLVPGRLAGVNGALQFVSERGQVQLDVPLDATRETPSTSTTTIGIRCEHVHEHPDGPIRGRVLSEEYLGNARIVHVDAECGRLVVRTDAARSRSPGSEIRLSFDPSEISVFDGTTEARL